MWINHYLEGNISAIEINCVIQWIVIYPLDKTYGLFEQPGPGEIFPRFGLICWVAVVVDQKVENFAEYWCFVFFRQQGLSLFSSGCMM